MLEMKIKVEAPDLAAAIEKLAVAITPLEPSLLAAPAAPTQPVSAPVAAPAAAPAPAAPAAPAAPPVVPIPPAAPTGAPGTAPVPAPANTAPAAPAAAPAPAVPVTAAPTYDLNAIAQAGSALVTAGKMEPLLALLNRYGVAAITQLKPEQYGSFVTELRALGAQI